MSTPPLDGSNSQPPATPPTQPPVPPTQPPAPPTQPPTSPVPPSAAPPAPAAVVPPAQPPVAPPPGRGYAPAPGTPGAPVKKGLAIAALVVGIAAILIFLVPVLGIIVALAGIVLGIIALAKKQPKGFALTGLILSAVATLGSILATILLAGFFFVAANQSATVTPTDSPSQTEETPGDDTDADPLADFPEVSASELADIVADPNAWVGQGLTLYGVVVQFDEGTGACSLRLYTSHEPKADPAEFEYNTLAYAGDGESDCPGFDVFAVDDVLTLHVYVTGQETYSNASGEEVRALQVDVWDAYTE